MPESICALNYELCKMREEMGITREMLVSKAKTNPKQKSKKIKHVHVRELDYSNQSVFRSNDKNTWEYKK